MKEIKDRHDISPTNDTLAKVSEFGSTAERDSYFSKVEVEGEMYYALNYSQALSMIKDREKYGDDGVKFYNPDKNESISRKLLNLIEEYLIDYHEWNQKVKEAIEEKGEEIKDRFELYSGETEEIEYKSRGGFISQNDGGFRFTGFTTLDYLNGTGTRFASDIANKQIEGQIEYSLELAKKDFIKENQEELKGIPENQIDYHSLYELKRGDLAEMLSEKEMSYLSDDSTIMLDLMCMYEDETKTFTVSSAINWESPYHRGGKNNEAFLQEEFTVTEGEDITSKLDNAFNKVCTIF